MSPKPPPNSARAFETGSAPFTEIRQSYRISPAPFRNQGGQIRRDRLKITSTGMRLMLPDLSGYHDISAAWLRDLCPCAECRNADTAQRRVNVFKRNVNCKIVDIQRIPDKDQYIITFGDGHKTPFAPATVLAHGSGKELYKRHGLTPTTLWDCNIGEAPPLVQYEEVSTNGLGTLLRKIREYGFCFVDGIDPTPQATEELLQCIGPIRNTHYGGFYDFTSDLSSKDTAYTSESLEPHTDNSYFTEPAGLQALHLLSHTDGSGGESSLVDGFYVARQIFDENPITYETLARTQVYAHASGNDGISIQPAEARPVLGHSMDTHVLNQVRWNNADRAGIHGNMRTIDRWYRAAAQFDAIVSAKRNQYWFQLKPGRLLIFDNWRVLHGRAAFTGKRRMCGGYIPRDDFISKFKATNFTPEEIRASTVTG